MNKEEILALCIQEIESGRSTLEDCISRYPGLEPELISLIKISRNIQPMPVEPDREFVNRAKVALIREMVTSENKMRGFWPFGYRRRLIGSLVVALIVFIIVGGGGYAARSSLPGQPLYAVKTGLEQIHLQITFDSEAKTAQYLRLVGQRITEAGKLISQGLAIDQTALAKTPTYLDSAMQLSERLSNDQLLNFINNFTEETSSWESQVAQLLAASPENPGLEKIAADLKRGQLIGKVALSNPDFLGTHPSVQDETLDQDYFKIQGTLLETDDTSMNVSGIEITGIETHVEAPFIQSPITVEGITRGNGIYISEMKATAINSQGGGYELEGVFNGTDDDGKLWKVGGLPLSNPGNDVKEPEKGEKIVVSKATSDSAPVIKVKKQDNVSEEGKSENDDGDQGTQTVAPTTTSTWSSNVGTGTTTTTPTTTRTWSSDDGTKTTTTTSPITTKTWSDNDD